MDHMGYRDEMLGISVSRAGDHLSLLRRSWAETVTAVIDGQESIIVQSHEYIGGFAFADV